MRPRHCCRGRLVGAGGLASVFNCFNEAAALLPRKATGISCLHLIPVSPASMRPRHCCRGRRRRKPRRRPWASGGFNEAAALLPRKAVG